MERDGLLLRERDAVDARRQVVKHTAQGKRMAAKLAQSIEAHYASMEAALGKPQLAQLYALLDAVIGIPSSDDLIASAISPKKRSRKAA
jgi:DNA-binding MarR family transcriptional regulator